ncbi:MAG TPA: hypothetical protein VM346_03765 [Sphingomicrobium sp.]|jgi:hypothetical protein|nr:hypothetical protein [Sphingomicrobium sp.]
MRPSLFVLPLALMAAPALAQQPVQQQQQRPAVDMRIPPELTDPRLTDRLVDVMQVLSKAFLDLPAGEVEAALEGRQPTSADRRKTVGSESGTDERQLRQQIEASRPAMQAGMQALASALPAMMRAMDGLSEELEKAAANLPRPDYPKR